MLLLFFMYPHTTIDLSLNNNKAIKDNIKDNINLSEILKDILLKPTQLS